MELATPAWRQRLLGRLELGMGRAMLDADLACVVWNDVAGTLTVQFAPLLAELRARNLISNVFRSPRFLH
jgi:hypothetical protein